MSLLTGIVAFANLDPVERDTLERASIVTEPRDGAAVFSQGDRADAVYAILSGDGHVRIGAADRRAKSLMVEVFSASDIFGEIGVIDGGMRSATAVAEGRLRLARVPGTAFMDALSRSPALGETLCRTLVRRLRRTFELFQDASFETLEVRLARQVLYLADREGRHIDSGIRLAGRLRQGDLADLLGTTTRSIITILNAWREAGLVLYDTQRAFLTVRDVDALRALTGENAS